MILGDIISAHAQLLDDIFGAGAYQIEATDEATFVKTEWMELQLVYDPRDQCVHSWSNRSEFPNLSLNHSTDTLLSFLHTGVGDRRQSRLDEQQVRDELNFVRPVIQTLKDERRSCDATWFVNGYNAAYTDYCSGKWEPT
jgi:hypothetical protein